MEVAILTLGFEPKRCKNPICKFEAACGLTTGQPCSK
jgi:hypothetical protein